MSIPPIAFSFLLVASAAGGQQSAGPGQAPPAPERSRSTETADGAVAHALDHGMRIGDPFPGKDAMPAISSTAHTTKARSIVSLAAVARARGLDRSPDVVKTMEAVRHMLLAEKLMQTMSDSIVIDQGEVRRTFDRFPDAYDEFEIAHIFLSADAPREGKGGDQEALIRARKAQAALAAGTPFESIAGSSSDDRESAVEGGVLPTVLGASIQPVFLAAVRTMKNGDVSGIVKGDQGYHIIRLLRRTHAFNGPSRDMIERQIKAREMQKLLPELRTLEESVQ